MVLVTGAGSGIGKAIALALAREGHFVYASQRDVNGRNRERSLAMEQLAGQENLDLEVLELDVLSETALPCSGRPDPGPAYAPGRGGEQRRMLMTGLTEAFSVEQGARIIDTNALSWLRVNRAALPALRRQGHGLLMYKPTPLWRGSLLP